MIVETLCLPFRIPNLYGGLAEVRGILKATRDALILDFEVKESFLDMFRFDSKVLAIPLADVSACELKRRWFSHSIVISVNRLDVLRQVPGSDGAQLRLKISGKHAAIAAEFVSCIGIALTTEGLKKLISQPG